MRTPVPSSEDQRSRAHWGKDCLNLLGKPRQIRCGDHERWRQAERLVVRILAQNTARRERLAKGPRRYVQLNANEQSSTTHFHNERRIDLPQAFDEGFTEVPCALCQLLIDDDA